MANSLFIPVLKKILDQDTGLDFGADTIKCVLIDTADDDPNVTTDDFFDDIAAGAREETATLASKTTTGGTFDAADFTFTAAAGDVCEEILYYSDTGGADSTDPLAISNDTFSSGMPVTLNSGDVSVVLNASGIFTFSAT